MNRQCVVLHCDNCEETTKCFPFPDDFEQIEKWKERLQMSDLPTELLKTRFVVCEQHFSLSDLIPASSLCFTNSLQILKEGALPSLITRTTTSTNDLNSLLGPGSDEHLQQEPSDIIDEINEQIMPALQVGVSALTLIELSDGCMARSTASTNKSDICILETNESHYGGDNDYMGSNNGISQINFTVLHSSEAPIIPPSTFENLELDAQQRHHHHSSSVADDDDELNDSTEILMHSEMTNNEVVHTDSDVEVLPSDEETRNHSDAEDDVDGRCLDDWLTTDTRICLPKANNDLIINLSCHETAICDPITTPSAEPLYDTYFPEDRHHGGGGESTEHDISVEEFSRSSAAVNCSPIKDVGNVASVTTTYDHLTREELLQVIARLEATIRHYHHAQQRLFEMVDDLRVQFGGDRSSHETIQQ